MAKKKRSAGGILGGQSSEELMEEIEHDPEGSALIDRFLDEEDEQRSIGKPDMTGGGIFGGQTAEEVRMEHDPEFQPATEEELDPHFLPFEVRREPTEEPTPSLADTVDTKIETPVEAQSTIALQAEKTEDLPESPEKNILQEDMQHIQRWYDGAKDRLEWMEVIERLGHALAQYGAAREGLRTGVDMSGLKFDKTDWNARRALLYKELEGKRGVARTEEEVRQKELERGVKREEISAKRERATQKAGLKLLGENQKMRRDLAKDTNSIINSTQSDEDKVRSMYNLYSANADAYGLTQADVDAMFMEESIFSWLGVDPSLLDYEDAKELTSNIIAGKAQPPTKEGEDELVEYTLSDGTTGTMSRAEAKRRGYTIQED